MFSQSIDTFYYVPSSAVPFMRYSLDAKISAMGDAGIAVADDYNAIFENTSKYAFLDDSGSVSFNYKNAYNSILSCSGYHRFGDANIISGGLIYNSFGNSYITTTGQVPQTYHPFEYAVMAGYARKLNTHFAFGINLKYIYSSILTGLFLNGNEMTPDGSAAADLNCYYQKEVTSGNKPGHFSFGVAVSNLGGKISYDNGITEQNIPANFGIGVGYMSDLDEQSHLQFSLELNKLMTPTPSGTDANGNGIPDYTEKSLAATWISSFYDATGGFIEELKEITIGSGFEYNFEDQFFIRGGYFYENKTKGGREYFNVGAGIHYSSFLLDMAYLIPATDLQATQQNTQQKVLTVSIAARF